MSKSKPKPIIVHKAWLCRRGRAEWVWTDGAPGYWCQVPRRFSAKAYPDLSDSERVQKYLLWMHGGAQDRAGDWPVPAEDLKVVRFNGAPEWEPFKAPK